MSRQQKQHEVKDFLKRQMESAGAKDGVSVFGRGPGGMNEHEVKLNKQVLEEIKQRKREKAGLSQGSQSFM